MGCCCGRISKNFKNANQLQAPQLSEPSQPPAVKPPERQENEAHQEEQAIEINLAECLPDTCLPSTASSEILVLNNEIDKELLAVSPLPEQPTAASKEDQKAAAQEASFKPYDKVVASLNEKFGICTAAPTATDQTQLQEYQTGVEQLKAKEENLAAIAPEVVAIADESVVDEVAEEAAVEEATTNEAAPSITLALQNELVPVVPRKIRRYLARKNLSFDSKSIEAASAFFAKCSNFYRQPSFSTSAIIKKNKERT